MISLRGCVTVKELQSHMRDYFQRQRQRRETNSKRFKCRPIEIPLQSIQPLQTNSNPPSPTRNKQFDPILFLILISIVGVFVWYDDNFRAILLELYDKSLGHLSLFNKDALLIVGLLVIVLVIYLVSRRK